MSVRIPTELVPVAGGIVEGALEATRATRRRVVRRRERPGRGAGDGRAYEIRRISPDSHKRTARRAAEGRGLRKDGPEAEPLRFGPGRLDLSRASSLSSPVPGAAACTMSSDSASSGRSRACPTSRSTRCSTTSSSSRRSTRVSCPSRRRAPEVRGGARGQAAQEGRQPEHDPGGVPADLGGGPGALGCLVGGEADPRGSERGGRGRPRDRTDAGTPCGRGAGGARTAGPT
jgi:hypothetical protein